MDKKEILIRFQEGQLSLEEAASLLEGIDDMGFASLDLSRNKRNGFPEIIYGEGKTKEQIKKIIESLEKENLPVLATRVDSEKGKYLLKKIPHGFYYETARAFVVHPTPIQSEHYIAVVTAGTSDMPVAEEAAITAETFGNPVKRIYDVGVAGIHRLFNRLDDIRGASVIIVIAGMEGALVSVVAGLVDVPVIAVPTSVGYGSNLQGLTTLMSMLTSCASGVTVVNIDNGFGAAYSASMINQIRGVSS
ncbi:nickel pincer cofactor biosynthesis protein LarB [Granulicatella elegans]|uniref:nickel pincer cofactor biosynthesis protein LarB n=1 Tax=Granulicatella elegans TaxID=137732 RepID=UPI000AEDDEC3|nr:nickel pincer cofactor biosynthesis protein LarB [Granulicatella elegans]UEA31991.1 nickel pincer cofactor biosynthesis protein LarB [Granulicatella elegans]